MIVAEADAHPALAPRALGGGDDVAAPVLDDRVAALEDPVRLVGGEGHRQALERGTALLRGRCLVAVDRAGLAAELAPARRRGVEGGVALAAEDERAARRVGAAALDGPAG